ncbi:hypothetical protein [Saccharolobus sp. A20]|nr:hypothetical protein [Sulfolobus sp. A20]
MDHPSPQLYDKKVGDRKTITQNGSSHNDNKDKAAGDRKSI